VFNAQSVRSRLALAAVAACLVLPSAAAAQNKFSVTPWVGSYYAISKFFDEGIGAGSKIVVDQSNTVMFGIRAAVPLGATLAAEASFGYAKSAVNFRFTNFLTDTLTGRQFDLATDDKGNVIVGSIRAVLRPRRSNLSLLAGAIIVNHSGKAWNDKDQITGKDLTPKRTTFGGVVGLGLRANVTPRFPIDIRAEMNLYSFDPDQSDDTANGFFPGKFQQDLVVSIGVPLGGK
jgi:hypothetical protein